MRSSSKYRRSKQRSQRIWATGGKGLARTPAPLLPQHAYEKVQQYGAGTHEIPLCNTAVPQARKPPLRSVGLTQKRGESTGEHATQQKRVIKNAHRFSSCCC